MLQWTSSSRSTVSKSKISDPTNCPQNEGGILLICLIVQQFTMLLNLYTDHVTIIRIVMKTCPEIDTHKMQGKIGCPHDITYHPQKNSCVIVYFINCIQW
jgi:hypothetical protein